MARGVDLYSRFVAWLKILLPLAALGILSTLFLISRSVDPTQTIPFASENLEKRAGEQKISEPFFAGATPEGNQISFTAVSAQPDPDRPSRAFADQVNSRIVLNSGTVVEFTAENGIMDEPKDEAELQGDVVLTTTTGYIVRTEQLITGMREVRAETASEIDATGPVGDFTAGKMLLTSNPETGNAHLLFTNGVKLVYDPTKAKED